MAKKKVELSEDQKQRNNAILRRLEKERERLVADTRALQEDWNNRKRRRRKR